MKTNMHSPFTHDTYGRPLSGCLSAPNGLVGFHSWNEGQLDVWEYESDFKNNHLVADRVDTCTNCGKEITVHIDQKN